LEAKERISMIAAALAGSLSLAAYLIYSWKTLQGESHPNISSWAVWSFLTILNFMSYKKLTGGWIKSLLPTTNTIMVLVTLVCVIRTGSAKGLSATDVVCFVLGICAGFSWLLQRSPVVAQILLQLAIVIGFIPTFIAIRNESLEPWDAWFLWTMAFFAQFISVRVVWERKTYVEFLYPVCMFICHGIVFMVVV
jgi:hypothetical protein